ncbi:MAG: methyltransferase domain-containing protein [Armatimonadota bacterium]
MDREEPPIALASYERMADLYASQLATKPHNAYYERPALLALLPSLSGKQVLDLGCGPGLYAEHLLTEGAAHVTAVDVSPRMVQLASERLAQQKVDVHLADVSEGLPFVPAAQFDLAIAPLMIHYLRHLDTAFTEINRVLKPGGRFVFSTHHPMAEYPGDSASGIYFDTEPVEQIWGELGSVRFFRRPLSDITEALSSSGFVIERLVEPKPTEAFREVSLRGYEGLMRSPNFLLIRARKETL